MACPFARFVIYYKDGVTVMEDRNDGKAWENAPKYEYVCPNCWSEFPYFPQAEFQHCPKCLREGQEIAVVRQSKIIAMGVQFDAMPMYDPYDDQPMRTSKNEAVRVPREPDTLKGSSTYNVGWFADKPAEIITAGKRKGHKQHGLRIGYVVDPQGHCVCKVGYLSRQQPATYTYYTTVHSLGLKEATWEKHHIKLEECGRRFVEQDRRQRLQFVSTSLGERIES